MQRVKAAARTEVATRGWVIVKRRERGDQAQRVTPQPPCPDDGLGRVGDAPRFIDTR
jgi:hypothetical protein